MFNLGYTITINTFIVDGYTQKKNTTNMHFETLAMTYLFVRKKNTYQINMNFDEYIFYLY